MFPDWSLQFSDDNSHSETEKSTTIPDSVVVIISVVEETIVEIKSDSVGVVIVEEERVGSVGGNGVTDSLTVLVSIFVKSSEVVELKPDVEAANKS